MTRPRAFDTATLLADGRVLVAGGEDDNNATSATAETYDPATGKFAKTGSMSTPRKNAAATVLADGRVLVAGGSDGTNALSSADIYDPATGTFSATGSMAAPREGLVALALPSGLVLVAGGDGPATSGGTSETYDPASGQFGAVQTMFVGRNYAVGCLLRDGRVLLVGGRSTNELVSRTAALFDSSTGSWSDTINLADDRVDSAVAVLPNGFVLIAGGSVASGGNASAEVLDVLDPYQAPFTVNGNLGSERAGPTATTLKDGSVLIVGGYTSPTTTIPSASIYTAAP